MFIIKAGPAFEFSAVMKIFEDSFDVDGIHILKCK